MKKTDLKTGMSVTLRGNKNKEYLVLLNTGVHHNMHDVFTDGHGNFFDLNDYNNNLCTKSNDKSSDIVLIKAPVLLKDIAAFPYGYYVTIYHMEEEAQRIADRFCEIYNDKNNISLCQSPDPRDIILQESLYQLKEEILNEV